MLRNVRTTVYGMTTSTLIRRNPVKLNVPSNMIAGDQEGRHVDGGVQPQSRAAAPLAQTVLGECLVLALGSFLGRFDMSCPKLDVL
jgi:hypothetical protein